MNIENNITMSLDDYFDEIKNLDKKYKEDKRMLGLKFIEINAKHKIGDIITDHIGTIKVEKILLNYIYYSNIPIAVYEGTEYKKDGTPRKKLSVRCVFENNIVNK